MRVGGNRGARRKESIGRQLVLFSSWPAPRRARARRGCARSLSLSSPHPSSSHPSTLLTSQAAPAPKPVPSPLPTAPPAFTPPSASAAAWTKAKLAFALPWRRTGSRAVLAIRFEGDISDRAGARFGPGASALSVPQIVSALEKAALDPRIEGVALRIGPVAAGWGKLQEIGAAMAAFRASGKWSRAWIERGGEKELYVAAMADKVYVPPVPGALSVRGVAVAGTFLRGPLEKAGVTPEIIRIGKFKSAGDSLLRKDMAPAQREALGAIVDDVYAHFTAEIAARRGLSVPAVVAALDAAHTEPAALLGAGLVDGAKYEDEVVEEMRVLTGLDPAEEAIEAGKAPRPLRAVPLRKYTAVSRTAFGLDGGWGAPRVAVVRASGAITGGGSGNGITPGPLVRTLNALAADKRVAAVVLRVDSPGGDALASDLIWRAARRLAARKPLVASMGDVAASGGYYIAMAAPAIVAQPLTLTGSIGIVTGKVALGPPAATTATTTDGKEAAGGGGGGIWGVARAATSASASSAASAGPPESLYERVGGYKKVLVSRGKFAELLTETRPFSPEERELFEGQAALAYASFRDKAAACRGQSVEALEAVAQGRVWTGREALERGLVDALGGVETAVAIAAAAAGVPAGVRPRVVELSRSPVSPLALLTGGGGGGGAAAGLAEAVAVVFSLLVAAWTGDAAGLGRALAGLAGFVGLGGGRGGGDGAAAAAEAVALATTSGRPTAAAPDVRVVGASELGRW
jgi:protease IV